MVTRDLDRLEEYRIGFVEYYLKRIAEKNHRILDVGCGMGQYRGSTSSSYIGIDITDEPYKENTPRDIDIVASGENIPSPSETYDLVFTIGTLYLISDPKKALSEFYRVLRRGGHVIVFDYNRRTHRRLQYKGGCGKLPCWTQWELKKLVQQAGFEHCELLLPISREIKGPAKWMFLLGEELIGSWVIITAVK